MTRSLASIEKEILELDSSSQEEILRVLVEALDGPPEGDVEAAWLAEAERRVAEIESGEVTCESAEDVFHRIDIELKK